MPPRRLLVYLRLLAPGRRPAVSNLTERVLIVWLFFSFRTIILVCVVCVCVCFSLHSVALLWPAEWEVIGRLFLVDQPISICRIHDTAQDNGNVQYHTQPGKPCLIVLVQGKALHKVQWLSMIEKENKPYNE